MGLTQGPMAAMVADVAPKELRGTAFGIFNLASGLALFFASVIAGGLWDGIGPSRHLLRRRRCYLDCLGRVGRLRDGGVL